MSLSGGSLTVVPPAQILGAFDGDAEHHGWLRDGICGGSPPLRRGVRPFNRKGRFALQCVDSPLVRQLLRRVMPDARYPPQFCKAVSSIVVAAARGSLSPFAHSEAGFAVTVVWGQQCLTKQSAMAVGEHNAAYSTTFACLNGLS